MTHSVFNGTEYQIGDCTYTNEGQLHRALLPERFQSTSTPEFVDEGERLEDSDAASLVSG